MQGARSRGPCSGPGMVGAGTREITLRPFGRFWSLGRFCRSMPRTWSPATPCWRCCHDYAASPYLCDYSCLRVSGGGRRRLCLPLPRNAVASTGWRVGRTHRVAGNCLRSIHAPRPRLGSLACACLDGIPRGSERLSLVPRIRRPWFDLCGDCLDSLSFPGHTVFSQRAHGVVYFWVFINTFCVSTVPVRVLA